MIQTERLSPEAMVALAGARQEAKRSGSTLIGTEHLLLGIVCSAGDTAFGGKLKDVKLTEGSVRLAMDQIVTPRQAHERDDLHFTPRVQRLIKSAFSEADGLGDALVEPQHILIAMLREDAGIASRIFERIEVNATTLLKALLAD